MPKYNVLSPFKHGEEIIKRGEVVLDAEDARELVASGSLQLIDEPAPVLALDDFRAALAKIDSADTAAFDKSGKVTVKALEAVGVKISGAQRDALWADHIANPVT